MSALPDHTKLIAGRYRLEHGIGHGSTSCVYAATDVVSGEPLAIKLLLPHLAADALSHERFRTGAHAAARLDHPNVIKTFGFGILPDGIAFTAMERLHGPTLRQHLRVHERLPVRMALKIAAQVAAAIAAAHDQQILHGDLTPTNILLHYTAQDELCCKVVDFGFVRMASASRGAAPAQTCSDKIVGTPLYMSPEHYAGKLIDIRADIFSLGAILYEMLTGRPPFPGDTPKEILRQHGRVIPDLRDANLPLAAQLQNLVAKALCVDPDGRWSTPAIFSRQIGLIQNCLARPAYRTLGAQPAPSMEDTVEINMVAEELAEPQVSRFRGGAREPRLRLQACSMDCAATP